MIYYGQGARVEVLRADHGGFSTGTFVDGKAWRRGARADKEVSVPHLRSAFPDDLARVQDFELAARIAIASALGFHPRDVGRLRRKPEPGSDFVAIVAREA